MEGTSVRDPIAQQPPKPDINDQFVSELKKNLEEVGVQPSEYSDLEFNHNPAAFPMGFPPVPAEPLTLTPFLHSFILANQFGMVVLHTEDIARQQKRLLLIIKDSQDRLTCAKEIFSFSTAELKWDICPDLPRKERRAWRKMLIKFRKVLSGPEDSLGR